MITQTQKPLLLFILFLAFSFRGSWCLVYKGCFKDIEVRGFRDLPLILQVNSLSPQVCANICRDAQFRYAGLQSGLWCTCGDSYGRHGQVSEAECQLHQCHYSPDFCGGEHRNRVYETGYVQQSASARLIGCYVDSPHARDLSYCANLHLRLVDTYNRKESCYTICKTRGYRYFGLQHGHYCFCGNNFGNYGGRGLHDCAIPCNGNKAESCGGVNTNLVFQI